MAQPIGSARRPLAARYELDWLLSLEMGPNPLLQLEDLLPALDLRRGDRVLDLGCGRGATSVFLAREFGVHVTAVDLWTDPARLEQTVRVARVADRVDVVRADARALPFGKDSFDAVVSIDAFEYFGTDVHFLPALLPVLRSGGRLAMSTPALRVDPYDVPPPAAVTALVGAEAAAWHAPAWWKRHWTLAGGLADVQARMQRGGHEDWVAWERALGERYGETSETLAMLQALPATDIGFALVTAVKR